MTERDKKAIRIAVGVFLVCAAYHLLCRPWVESWGSIRDRIRGHHAKIEQLNPVDSAVLEARQKTMWEKVPCCQTPKSDSEQRLLCKTEFVKQLEKNRVEFKSLNYVSKGASPLMGQYDQLLLQCRATCRFEQIVNLMADIYRNPCIVSVEEFRIQGDPKRQGMFNLTLTVSTFAARTEG